MRQNGPQRRGRGRSSGRRSNGNALNRNYESNGPDVKIRGTAAHVAEKYIALSRDAAAAGDRIASENYLQHAEHYNRIVAAIAEQAAERQAAEQERRDRHRRGPKGSEDSGELTDTGAPADDSDTASGSADVVEIVRGEDTNTASMTAESADDGAEPAKPQRRPARRRAAKADAEGNNTDASRGDTAEGRTDDEAA